MAAVSGPGSRSRVQAQLSSCRHHTADLANLSRVEQSCRRRKQLLILDGNVALTQRLSTRQTLPQFGGLRQHQTIIREPPSHQHVDCRVMLCGFVVVPFEPVEPLGRGGVAGVAQPWKQAHFLVSRVPRRRNWH